MSQREVEISSTEHDEEEISTALERENELDITYETPETQSLSSQIIHGLKKGNFIHDMFALPLYSSKRENTVQVESVTLSETSEGDAKIEFSLDLDVDAYNEDIPSMIYNGSKFNSISQTLTYVENSESWDEYLRLASYCNIAPDKPVDFKGEEIPCILQTRKGIDKKKCQIPHLPSRLNSPWTLWFKLKQFSFKHKITGYESNFSCGNYRPYPSYVSIIVSLLIVNMITTTVLSGLITTGIIMMLLILQQFARIMFNTLF